MFGFLKNLFKKKEEEDTGGRPLELMNGDEVTLHQDAEIPKLWPGTVSAVEDKTFSITTELKDVTSIPFNKGDDVNVSVAKGEETARFRGRVINVQKTSPALIVLERPKRASFESRIRKHVRVPTNIPAKLALDEKNPSWHMVHISDISLSGLSIYTPQAFKKGDHVTVKLMSMQYPLDLEGEVVRVVILVEHSGDKDNPDYNLGIRLYPLGDIKEQMLSEFIYHVQRKSSEFEKRYLAY